MLRRKENSLKENALLLRPEKGRKKGDEMRTRPPLPYRRGMEETAERRHIKNDNEPGMNGMTRRINKARKTASARKKV